MIFNSQAHDRIYSHGGLTYGLKRIGLSKHA